MGEVRYADYGKNKQTKKPTLFSLSEPPHPSFRITETRTSKKDARLSKTDGFARRSMVEKGERGERRFEFETDLPLNAHNHKKKNVEKIPKTSRVPFVTRSVLPPENFQARLVVFPRRRSGGRAGGNHRLFLFQNWVRHDV